MKKNIIVIILNFGILSNIYSQIINLTTNSNSTQNNWYYNATNQVNIQNNKSLDVKNIESKVINKQSNKTDCESQITRSYEKPSFEEFQNFSISEDDDVFEICKNSSISIVQHKTANGRLKGYTIQHYSKTGKRILDEFLDENGRTMQQYVYEYLPNDKAKYMYIINYLGEVTALRAVQTKGMKDINFEIPYPSTKEKAIYRYLHPNKMSFTDVCQDCRGSGLGNNNLHRCYICNGAGKITHTIVKY